MTDRRPCLERPLVARGLVAYYGFIQAAHLIALLRAAILLLTTGRLTFPAPPPPPGWTDQARYFLVTLGLLDTFLILLSFAFVAGYFARARWHSWLGLATLSAFVASAFAFAGGTLPTGAWAAHPLAYLSLVLAFLPVVPLFLFCLAATAREQHR
ncbi:MAG TPA: hypothetical protein VLC95_15940 [Anaerolineae bacterium]|nr:hypothetical protein [Anaerolineae bacterium]